MQMAMEQIQIIFFSLAWDFISVLLNDDNDSSIVQRASAIIYIGNGSIGFKSHEYCPPARTRVSFECYLSASSQKYSEKKHNFMHL